MTGAITLAATAVVGLGVGAYESSQEQGLQKQGLALAKDTQGEQEYYNSLLQQLIANPSSVSTLPGYQFDLSQGSKAVAAGMGPSGLTGSGNEGAALTTFGQGLASSFYGQQANLLASLSGVTAPSSPAQGISAATGAGALSANTLSGLLNSLGFYGTLAGKYSGSTTGAPAGTPGASPGDFTPAGESSAPAWGGYTPG